MSTDMIVLRTEMTTERVSADKFLEHVDALVLASPEDLELAGALLVRVAAACKGYDERRTRITKPMLAAKREVDELFKPVLEPLKRAEAVLRDKVERYTVGRNAERVALMQSGETRPDALAPVEQTKGVSVREVWTYVVEDPALVPRRFLCVDHDAIKKHCSFANTERTPPLPIEGVRFERVGRTTVRT